MTTAAIEYIWQAILESERSDDLSFIDTLKRSLMPQPDRPSAITRSPSTAATEPLQTVTLPLMLRS